MSVQAILKGVSHPLAWKLYPAAVELLSGIRPASATRLCFGCDEYHFSSMAIKYPSLAFVCHYGSIQRTVSECDVY